MFLFIYENITSIDTVFYRCRNFILHRYYVGLLHLFYLNYVYKYKFDIYVLFYKQK